MDRHRRLHTSARTSHVPLPVERVRAVVADGRRGPRWYVDALPFLVRGGLDRLVGGAPLVPPPGRELLEPGDRVGFWRVVTSTGDELLIRAEVRAPGTVTLRTTMRPDGAGTRVEQTVRFEPSGLLGRAYLLADLPAREAVIELAHRRLLRDLAGRTRH